ncbi:MAG: Mur ligase domain-containing protein [Elusimicrobiota bacterium]|jgi:UDP-N-acetylmuramate--alanine ligase
MNSKEKIHFVGVGGQGMSALAQFHAFGGAQATGSDRYLDRGQLADVRGKFSALGIRLFPQDGSGIDKDTARVVLSTAIEDSNADLAKAKSLGTPVIHRAEFLAELVAAHRTLAVTGTSGKSTVTGMVFEVLDACGRSPSVITGAGLRLLEARGLVGNAARGTSDLLAIEADESDGSLVRYRPWLGALLSIGRDHKELPVLLEMFRTFRAASGRFVVNADVPLLKEFQPKSTTFGFSEGSAVRGAGLRLEPGRLRMDVNGVPFDLPLDGKHNAENALAAAAICMEVGVELKDCAKALASYRGVMRRFERVGTERGVTVIDDYAHNPDKAKAVLAAARLCGKRLLAIYQPHGFGPTRFVRNELIEVFSSMLGSEDVLWMPEIYYAGGTAVKDISSADIVKAVCEKGRRAYFCPERGSIPQAVAKEARSGDVVLLMGARDPSLGDFARDLLQALQ